jgi:hypothetical protein
MRVYWYSTVVVFGVMTKTESHAQRVEHVSRIGRPVAGNCAQTSVPAISPYNI